MSLHDGESAKKSKSTSVRCEMEGSIDLDKIKDLGALEANKSLLDETDELIKRNHELTGTASIGGATMNFINTIIGAGIIGLPYAMVRCGYAMGIILLFVVAVMTDYTARLLILAGMASNTKSYEDIAKRTFGKKFFYLTCVLMALFAYGALLVYLIIIGDVLPPVLGNYIGGDIVTDRRIVVAVTSTIIILPLCCLKDMGNLAYSSFLSVFAEVAIVILVLIYAPATARNEGISVDTADSPYQFVRPTVFGGIGTMATAYVCHHSAFLVFNSLKDRTIKNWKIVSQLSIGTAFVLSVALASGGYLSFFDMTQDDILENFPADNTAINLARIALAASMFLTFPMECFVVRHVLAELFTPLGKWTNCQHYTITFLIWGTCTIIGVFVSNLGFVLEINGAIGGTMIGYTFPCLIYFNIFGFGRLREKSRNAWDPTSSDYKKYLGDRIQAWINFWMPLIIAILGVISMFAGSVTAILSIV